MRVADIDFYKILLGGKSHENNLIYNVLYKSFVVAKPLRISFDKIDKYFKIKNGTRYLVLFGLEIYGEIYDWIESILSEESDISYIISQNFAKIKVNSYDSLSPEKAMTFDNVIILIKSVFNIDKNNYYYNIILEKASYKLSIT